MATTKTDTRSGVLVKMPPKLKRAVVREVSRRKSNMNDVCVQILSEHYDEEFDPSGRRADPGDAADVVLRVTKALKRKIQDDALDNESNMGDTILQILAERLNVKIPAPASRRATPFGGGRRAVAA